MIGNRFSAVVLPAEDDASIVGCNEAAVRDSDTVEERLLVREIVSRI
jgi:hypothetical protein